MTKKIIDTLQQKNQVIRRQCIIESKESELVVPGKKSKMDNKQILSIYVYYTHCLLWLKFLKRIFKLMNF